jgi:hypothetical protein
MLMPWVETGWLLSSLRRFNAPIAIQPSLELADQQFHID